MTVVATSPACTALRAASIGHLVPVRAFAGVVHSVFARACNVAVRGTLLTLVARRGAEGPTAIVLDGTTPDLRTLLRVGNPVQREGDRITMGSAIVSLDAAAIWTPASVATALPGERIRANVALVAEAMRAYAPPISPFAGAVAARAAALEEAVAGLDTGAAQAGIAALLGLGEGLTPSGDDFVVGLLAGLELLAAGAARARFLAGLRRHVDACRFATTDLSAHQLRLAAGGHFSAAIERLRNGIVDEVRPSELMAALQRALDFGATSGADTVRGVIAAFRAWLPGRAEGASA